MFDLFRFEIYDKYYKCLKIKKFDIHTNFERFYQNLRFFEDISVRRNLLLSN
nr:MAG TPA: hypothetical protein [Caudoviricetes sp.]